MSNLREAGNEPCPCDNLQIGPADARGRRTIFIPQTAWANEPTLLMPRGYGLGSPRPDDNDPSVADAPSVAASGVAVIEPPGAAPGTANPNVCFLPGPQPRPLPGQPSTFLGQSTAGGPFGATTLSQLGVIQGTGSVEGRDGVDALLHLEGPILIDAVAAEPTPTYPNAELPDWIVRLIRKVHSSVKDRAKGDKSGFVLVSETNDKEPAARVKMKDGASERVYCGGRVDYYAVINELPKGDGGTMKPRDIWDWAYAKVEADAKKKLGDCIQKACEENSALTNCQITRSGAIGKLEQIIDGAVVKTLGCVEVPYVCKCAQPPKKGGADGPVTGPKDK